MSDSELRVVVSIQRGDASIVRVCFTLPDTTDLKQLYTDVRSGVNSRFSYYLGAGWNDASAAFERNVEAVQRLKGEAYEPPQ